MKQVKFDDWCEFLIEIRVYFTEGFENNVDTMFAKLAHGPHKGEIVGKACYHDDGHKEYFIKE